MFRKKTVLVVLLGLTLTVPYASASRFYCGRTSEGEVECENDAWCSGDYYERSGCSYQCYNEVEPGGGVIKKGSSASCSAGGGGGIPV